MSQILLNQEQADIAAGSIVAGPVYADIVTLDFPCRILLVQNLTDATVQFSIDGGRTKAFPLPANGLLVLDFTANHTLLNNEQGPMLPKGSTISVQRIGTPTTGSVYVSMFYEYGD